MSAVAEPIVSTEALSKRYLLGERAGYGSLRDDLTQFATRFLHGGLRSRTPERQLWALNDVSIQVAEGEIVGLIGRNGAGKSTLLKVLSRITEPTSGRAVLNGRVASLLEVGTGFHPELTGRENVFLNGALLGMKREETRAKFDEIVDFSEVEDFLDTPVKRYSSGMHVRLAFAVAAHLEPEILLIDEVLAVGDAAFQQKCLGKMGTVARSGRTVLFVSHNLKAVRDLCPRSILLEAGAVAKDGPSGEVIEHYLNNTLGGLGSVSSRIWHAGGQLDTEKFAIHKVRMTDAAGIERTSYRHSEAIHVHIHHCLKCDLSGVRLILHVMTPRGETVFATTDHIFRDGYERQGDYVATCILPSCFFNEETYILRIGATVPRVESLIDSVEVMRFSVEDVQRNSRIRGEKFSGIVAPEVAWALRESKS